MNLLTGISSLPLFFRSLPRSKRVTPLALLAIGLGPMVSGCGGGPAPTTPVTPVIPGTVTFAAPANGSTITSLPTTVTLNLQNGATLTNTKVTLDGADITSKFTASGTTATATVSVGVYLGNNRLVATIGSNTAKAGFIYDPSGTPGGGLPPGGPGSTVLSDVIPIQTRVQMTNAQNETVWGIQIGQTAYPAPDSTPAGMQVLVLQRTTLVQISNTDYPLVDAPSVINFGFLVGAGFSGNYTNLCGIQGCLVIVQSLNTIGTLPCSSLLGAEACAVFTSAMTSLGASGLLNTGINDSNSLAYSLIANVTSAGLHTGSSFERLTCMSADGCVEQSNPGQTDIVNGIIPNGVDGTLPNLASTGSSGTTTVAATAYMPAMTVSNNGAMGGALILDNYNAYTFTYAEPAIHYQAGSVSTSQTPKHIVILEYPDGKTTFPGGSTTAAVESAQLPNGANGGFHLAAWDSVTWQNLANSTYVIDPTLCGAGVGTSCTSPDGTPIYPIANMIQDIKNFNSRRVIFFLGSIGKLDHNMADPYNTGDHSAQMQDTWDRIAQSVQDIGGTYSLFVGLNNPGYQYDPYDQYTANAIPEDDYNLVGQWWLNDTGVANPLGVETSTAISRQIEKYPVGGNTEGTLEKGVDGYYRVGVSTTHATFLPDATFSLVTAPTMLPIAWPLTGANDSNALKAAYQWISEQLLLCVSGCVDIRAAYTNLNQSPSIWLATLSALTIPSDCAGQTSTMCPLGFGQTEFDTAQTQLLAEIRDLGLVRQYQSNVLGLLQSEQANVSVILQQANDELLGNVHYVTSALVSGGGWKQDTEDAFKIAGPLVSLTANAVEPGSGAIVGPLVNSGFGVADLLMDQAAKRITDPNGRSLIEQAHEQIAASALAQQKADQYADTLVTIGADFTRIVSDWGRLQRVAGPILDNHFVWAPETDGALLKCFDAAIRRSFYSELMPTTYAPVHYGWSDPGEASFSSYGYRPGYSQCYFWQGLPGLLQSNPDSYAFLPGALIDGPGSTVSFSVNVQGDVFPIDLWWDVWLLQDSNDDPTCPTSDTSQLPTQAFYNATGLFRPLDPADPTPLGFYKPWFYTRSGFTVNEQGSQSTNFWYQNGVDGQAPFVRGAAYWQIDPDSY